jgi:hypothetical protein
MRPNLVDPVQDQAKLRELLPLTERVFSLHEAGLSYDAELEAISQLLGRTIEQLDVYGPFGSGDSEYFARRLLTDWDNLPTDLSYAEMLELLEALIEAKGTQDRREYWMKCLEASTGEPELINLICWPDQYRNGEYADRDLSIEETLEVALRYGTRLDA